MRIMDIDIEKVRAQAKQTFPDQFIQIETGSLFIPDSEAGTYTCDYMEDLLYISTCMGYHEVMIKGNKTRVKVEITLVFLKKNPYEVIYEGMRCCHVAMADGEQISFIPYDQFLLTIGDHIHPAQQPA